MNDIEMLLSEWKWPCLEALTFGDGRMVLFDLIFRKNKDYYFAPITDSHVSSFLSYGKDKCTHINYCASCETPDFTVYAGDGAAEDEGTVWVKDKAGNLVWFYYFNDISAFDAVYVEDEIVHASVRGEYWNTRTVFKIPIKSPLDLGIYWVEDSDK